jgi:hypothetical protein
MKRPFSALPWLAVLAVALVPRPAPGQVLRYDGEPGAARTYVREQHDRVVQTVNGRQLATEIRSYWRLSATVVEAGPEELTLVIAHDSLAVSGPPGAADLDLAAVYGIGTDVVMSRRGAVSEVRVADSLPPAAARLDLATTYRSFFPRLPEGEASEGTQWADTTFVVATQNGLDVRIQRLNRYVSKGWATQGPLRVVRIDYESDLTVEGSGEQQEAGIVLSGTGRGSGGFSFDPAAGAFVAGGETTEMRMVALVTARGQNLVIPIVQNRTETISLATSAEGTGEPAATPIEPTPTPSE